MGKTSALKRITHFLEYWGGDTAPVIRYRPSDARRYTPLHAADIREVVTLAGAATDLRAALEQLRNAGGHRYHCAFEMDVPCSCGLDEALKVSSAAIAKAVAHG